MTISTHVLDSTTGRPAAGVGVKLEAGGAVVAAQTDGDGRIAALPTPGEGVYRLVFDLDGRSGFYPEVVITFRVSDPAAHYHVPLLLSPFAYSTYRGS
ncbi:MAG TPA: hydroxyisourate hydrolase [Micromonosporaceae bacterium]|nr:hydroxyisourate hydrolase [Micromonosporaceae bacterium]